MRKQTKKEIKVGDLVVLHTEDDLKWSYWRVLEVEKRKDQVDLLTLRIEYTRYLIIPKEKIIRTYEANVCARRGGDSLLKAIREMKSIKDE